MPRAGQILSPSHPPPSKYPTRQVVNIEAPEAFVGALCHSTCLPRLALRAAALREALCFLGHAGEEGREVVTLAAFHHPEAFSAAEAAELLAFERGAAVLEMQQRERRMQAL